MAFTIATISETNSPRASRGPINRWSRRSWLGTIGLYLVNMFTNNALFEFMALRLDVFTRPWNVWQFVTYGFTHSPSNLSHIVVNMFMFWVFGRMVEEALGATEFLRFYLLAIVLGGAAWAITDKIAGADPRSILIGASAGVAGVIILFALKFPHQELRLYFLFPIKAWVLGVIFIAGDIGRLIMETFGQPGTQSGPQVAFMAHLGGAATALAYVKLGWNLGRVPPFSWMGGGVSMPKLGENPSCGSTNQKKPLNQPRWVKKSTAFWRRSRSKARTASPARNAAHSAKRAGAINAAAANGAPRTGQSINQ